ncbi:TonB-dependent receptor plug domain-containing protein [Undibacterium sp. SXout20W]|uniref:TonB-dependent receptor plug domain-containing protein n=1 Tax=Undibacterium sp. SXout20W TaxID=3413051 RepID=UPI003BF37E7E
MLIIKNRILRQALAAAGLLAFYTPSIYANDQGSETGAATISIIGSRAKARSLFDSDVPIDIFTAKDLERAGNTGELGQLLQNLSPSINMPKASASGTSDTIRTIQLRGLAPDEVLILVNGKRWHPNATMDQEGLFQGTVSVDLNALPVSAIERIEILRDGAGSQYGSDAVAGVINIVLKKASSGTDTYVSYGGNHTNFSPLNKTITDGQNFQVGVNTGLKIGDKGYVRFGFDYQDKNGTNRAGPSADSSYNGTPADEALVGKVLFKSGDPQLYNTNLFFNGALPLSDDVELYSFATYNQRRSLGIGFFRWPGDPGNVLAVYPNGFLPVSVNRSNDFGAVVGARGEVGEWNLDVSLRLGRNYFSYDLENTINSSLDGASPTRFHLANFISTQQGINIDVHRSFDGILPTPLNVAIGAESQRDAYRTEAGDPASYLAGSDTNGLPGAQGDPGLQPSDTVNLSRYNKSAYINVDSDLSKHLLLGVAARYSNIGDIGGKATGKVSFRYKFSPDFLVRGSISNSFRAPELAQVGFRNTVLGFNSAGQLSNVALVPATDPLAQGQGAQALKPESSVNETLGLAYRAPDGTYLTLDAYQIKLKDRIALSSPISINDPNYPTLNAVNFLTNGLDTTTKGIETVVQRDVALADSKLSLTAALNYNHNNLDSVRTGIGGTPLFNAKTLYDLMHATPKTKLVLSGDWQVNQWNINGRLTRYGTLSVMSYDPSSAPFEFDAAWTLDLEAKYTLNKTTSILVGANNLTDKYPTRTTNPNDSYSGAFPYNYVSPIGINGRYLYARLNHQF